MPIVSKSGSLNLLELSGPVQTCNGIALTIRVRTLTIISLSDKRISLVILLVLLTWSSADRRFGIVSGSGEPYLSDKIKTLYFSPVLKLTSPAFAPHSRFMYFAQFLD